ncbi:hypothetical protein [Vibrio sp. B1Z05]|uniref:hypothetical protein n=1 Tax=Vibrio sp. B1Z05 TaxID=2654980 RepID=UPI00128D0863|nr:hypothetical protein [Vibrio sp. B1Z05]MPW35841.1 hypothetical protein [Vibrio sp. B1Z05]
MQPIDKPWEQLQKAESYIEKMSSAENLEDYEDHWKDFLHNLERAWNKLVSHLKRTPKYEGWVERGRTEKLRRQDQLLSYLVNARGAEEHSIADITSKESGGIGINPAIGNSLHINKLEMKDGQIHIDSDQPLKIEFFPGKVTLLPIENRGRSYGVPTSHLGRGIEGSNPVELAKHGVEFYRSYFKKAEQHFVK